MKIFFVDDSKQFQPTREKLGPLVAVGGFALDHTEVRATDEELEALCQSVGFPKGEIFKWSPQKNHWMRDALIEGKRADFQKGVIDILRNHDAKAVFICEDTTCKNTDGHLGAHEMDVVKLLFERVQWHLNSTNMFGEIVVDRPGGDHKDEEKFLLGCSESLRSGSKWMKFEKIITPVLSSPSKLTRLLQAADLIVSCTLSQVSGESNYSRPIFDHLKDLFISEGGRVGGVGVKLHPQKKMCNLYHWLFGDTIYKRGFNGVALPWDEVAFPVDPDHYYKPAGQSLTEAIKAGLKKRKL